MSSGEYLPQKVDSRTLRVELNDILNIRWGYGPPLLRVKAYHPETRGAQMESRAFAVVALITGAWAADAMAAGRPFDHR